jgi:DeoR family transcriptional regulator of aga operon
VVILDSGTTTTAIARAIKHVRDLTVITNAVNIAAELAGTPIEVILTGGILRENSFSLVGPLAEETLGRLSADIFFLAVDGFDVHYGPTTPNLLEAKVNREMSKISRRTVCVCDSSKFGRRSLSQIITISSIHQVITDNRITAADLNELTEAGIKVTVV